MTTYEIARLFVAIVAIYAVPAAICWYLIDRKIKMVEQKLYKYIDYMFGESMLSITEINYRLRNIK